VAKLSQLFKLITRESIKKCFTLRTHEPGDVKVALIWKNKTYPFQETVLYYMLAHFLVIFLPRSTASLLLSHFIMKC